MVLVTETIELGASILSEALAQVLKRVGRPAASTSAYEVGERHGSGVDRTPAL